MTSPRRAAEDLDEFPEENAARTRRGVPRPPVYVWQERFHAQEEAQTRELLASSTAASDALLFSKKLRGDIFISNS
jgi:hypothetical protein